MQSNKDEIIRKQRSNAGKIGFLKSADTQRRLFQERIDAYNKNPKRCRFCNSVISYNKRRHDTCNHACATSFSHSQRGHASRVELNCKWCNNKFTTIRKNKNFCCIQCSTSFSRSEIFKSIESGATNFDHRRYRDYLIFKYGEKCSICGWDKKNPKTGKCPVEMEHVDGNSKNNSIKNLRLVCPNCHSLTPTYKNLNKGNGRFIRMKRYREGKSY